MQQGMRSGADEYAESGGRLEPVGTPTPPGVADRSRPVRSASPPAGQELGDFLIKLTCAEPTLIPNAQERRWYQRLGLSMVFTAVCGAIGMLALILAAYPSLRLVPLTYVGVLLWGAIIFVVDSLIVGKPSYNPKPWAKWTQIGLRVAIAVTVALFISEGIVLTAFHQEINEQIQADNQAKSRGDSKRQADLVEEVTAIYADATTAIENQKNRLDTDRTTAKDNRVTAEKVVACEHQGLAADPVFCRQRSSGNGGQGTLTTNADASLVQAQRSELAALAAYDDYMVTKKPLPAELTPEVLAACDRPGATELTEYDARLCPINAQIAEATKATPPPDRSTTGLLRRVVASFKIGHGEGWDPLDAWVVALTHLGAVLLLLFIDLVPLFAKFGGTTGHDEAVRATFRARPPHFLDNDLPQEAGKAAAEERATFYAQTFRKQAADEIVAAHADSDAHRLERQRDAQQRAVNAQQRRRALQAKQVIPQDRQISALGSVGYPDLDDAPPTDTDDPISGVPLSEVPTDGQPQAGPALSEVPTDGEPGLDSAHARSGNEATPVAGNRVSVPVIEISQHDDQRVRPTGLRRAVQKMSEVTSWMRRPTPPKVGTILETTNSTTALRFELLKDLAHNADGESKSQNYGLWQARDETGRILAVKSCVAPSEDAAVQALMLEANFCGMYQHRGIIHTGSKLHRDVATEAWFLEMPYYPAGDLDTYLRSQRITLGRAIAMADELMAALHRAHTMGFLHRDIKPRNILVDVTNPAQPRPVLADWGIARLIRGINIEMSTPGMVLGTRRWAPLEQLDSSVYAEYGLTDTRTHPLFTPDLWAVAAVLYWIITGESPRHRISEEAGMSDPDIPTDHYARWLREAKPPIPRLDEDFVGVPTELADAVAQWLSYDPRQRAERPGQGTSVMADARAVIRGIVAANPDLDHIALPLRRRGM
ncbi:DUF4407 domain-containing protein [Nocardia lasii]|uniref:DUF4407 domain-containing protein n=1 Tax=Nocardia lasii TaxID=1616107 RepID=A0ABW1JT06_9NOCA